MGFLEKLWDETVAGPTPETGLGKLRKYNSFSASSTGIHSPVKENMPISRSITLVKNSSAFRSSSEPNSPSSDSVTPRSPFSPEAPGGDFKKFTRRKASAHAEESDKHRSPNISNWVIMSALDRC